VLDEHTMPPDVLLISPIVWNQLTADQQQILQAAVDESVTYQRKLWAEFQQESLEAIAAAGVKIVKPDKQPFRDAVSKMLAKYDGTPIGILANKIGEVK
jgi:TRAP-type C4-dicarboxylate transport system substrate-binding protein